MIGGLEAGEQKVRKREGEEKEREKERSSVNKA